VHSVQSIKRLLEREGFDVPTKKSIYYFLYIFCLFYFIFCLGTLKIAVIKDRENVNYALNPSMLPNLREIPHL
jgi:hypothetical protein